MPLVKIADGANPFKGKPRMLQASNAPFQAGQSFKLLNITGKGLLTSINLKPLVNAYLNIVVDGELIQISNSNNDSSLTTYVLNINFNNSLAIEAYAYGSGTVYLTYSANYILY